MGRSRRQPGHTAANAVTVGYLVAAAVALAAHGSGPLPTWLIVHLLMLGAITNAIVSWSAHFASALLQRPPLPPAVTMTRLVALNIGVVSVLGGVSEGWRWLVMAGAALMLAVIAGHLGTQLRAVHLGRAKRFAGSLRFYWVAAAAVLVGIGLGVPMALGDVSSLWYERFYLAHVQLGLLGWVTLTVLGTEVSLWPVALRTKMVAGAERAALWSLAWCGGGLVLVVAGLLSWVRVLTWVGLAGFIAGVIVFCVPFVRTGRQRIPYSPATVMLAASTAWLLAGVVADAVALGRSADPFAAAARMMALVPWLVTGFVIQVLLGAMSYLVPIVLSGSPALGRRRGVMLAHWWVARVVALNVGTVLIALPGGGVLDRIGWLLVAAAIVSFAALALATVFLRTAAAGSFTRKRGLPPESRHAGRAVTGGGAGAGG